MARIALREAAYTALAARITARLSGIPLERNRRSLIGDGEAFPTLVLRDGPQTPVEEPSFGEDAWDVSAVLEGYVSSPDADAGAETSDLYARAAEALSGDPIVLAGTLPCGIPVEVQVTEGAFDFDPATVTESGKPIAAFYLDLTFQLRVPAGTRFLNTP